MNKPVLFCYDGSDGSKTALAAAVELIKPADAVVLVVWMPAAVQLARAGSFLAAVPNEGEIDEQEADAARQLAEEGAAGARRRGYNASARIAQANESVRLDLAAAPRRSGGGAGTDGNREQIS